MATVRSLQGQIWVTDYFPLFALGAFFRLYTREKPTDFHLERNIDSLNASSSDGKKKTVIVTMVGKVRLVGRVPVFSSAWTIWYMGGIVIDLWLFGDRPRSH